MEYHEKILLAVAALLIVLAVYFALQSPVPQAGGNATANASAAEALLMKGLLFGAGQEGYAYSYRDVSDGYRITYSLARNGNESTMEVRNPLSYKKLYFLSNDTVLCITYGSRSGCASVKGVSDLNNYLNSLEAKFFDDAVIRRNRDDLAYLIYHGYARIEPATSPGTVEGRPCTLVSYALDFSNMTVDEASRFGVGMNTPRAFSWRMCIDNSTGYVWERSFNYTAAGSQHGYTSTMLSFSPGPAAIAPPPENLTGDVVDILLEEKEQQIRLANCYLSKQGDELDRCIASIALDIRMKGLCDYAGGRRDRCLVSLVPVTKDEGLCKAIESVSYRDDCLIELAGAFRNSTWCSSLQNASKTEFCLGVASRNQTGSGIDIQKFLEYVENKTADNSSNRSNGTG